MKFSKIILTVAIAMAATIPGKAGIDLKSLASKVASGSGNSTVNSLVNNVLSTSKLEVSDLAGTWKCTGPAIQFKSEDLLTKAGGVAAATTIENKVSTYFKKAGLQNCTFTFTSDGKFTLTLKNGRKISGTVTKGTTDGTFIFNFGTIGKISVGKVTTYVSKGTDLSIMFNATKLITIVNAVAKYSGNSSISTVATLLKSYSGMYAGFKCAK